MKQSSVASLALRACIIKNLCPLCIIGSISEGSNNEACIRPDAAGSPGKHGKCPDVVLQVQGQMGPAHLQPASLWRGCGDGNSIWAPTYRRLRSGQHGHFWNSHQYHFRRGRVEASNLLREVRREIDRREARVASLESESDQKIAILKNKKRYANNNLAGATWEESISSEMQVITDQYQSKIDAEHRKLDRLQEQADQLAESL